MQLVALPLQLRKHPVRPMQVQGTHRDEHSARPQRQEQSVHHHNAAIIDDVAGEQSLVALERGVAPY